MTFFLFEKRKIFDADKNRKNIITGCMVWTWGKYISVQITHYLGFIESIHK